MIEKPGNKVFSLSGGSFPNDSARTGGTTTYFMLAMLGLSFWFFLGLPFASHRETYAWLAGVQPRLSPSSSPLVCRPRIDHSPRW